MKLNYLLVLSLCWINTILAKVDLLNFKTLKPINPSYESQKFNSATGYPNSDYVSTSYINKIDKFKDYDIDNIIKNYMEEYHPNIEYIKKHTKVIDRSKDTIVTLVQAYNGIEISNSEIKIIMNSKGLITKADMGIWEDLPVNKFNKRDTEVSVLFMLAALAEQLEVELNINKVEYIEVSKNEFIASNVTYSSDGKVRIKKVFITEENHLESAWELNFLSDYVYVTYNLRDRNGDVFSGEQFYSKFTKRNINYDITDIIHHVSPLQIFYDPLDMGETFTKYSPFGWHKDNNVKYEVTVGNNVRVRNNKYESAVSNSLDYLKYYNREHLSLDALTNGAMEYVFHTINLLHDAFYLLGFDENSRNMQKYNFGKKGEENDRVVVIVDTECDKDEDDPETVVAAMTTYRDGLSPYLLICGNYDSNGRVYLDAAFSTGILAHEYTHAVLSRISGIKFNDITDENKGMEDSLNEGFADFFAEALHYKPGMDRYTKYEIPYAVRDYPITSDMNENPLKYSHYIYSGIDYLDFDPHKFGQIWASMLHEVLWEVIEAFDKKNNNNYSIWDVVYQDIPREKRPYYVILLTAIIKSFSDLRDNNKSSFLIARDKILQYAKTENDNNKFLCAIEKGFARRGLGFGGKAEEPQNEGLVSFWSVKDDFEIPSECKKYYTN